MESLMGAPAAAAAMVDAPDRPLGLLDRLEALQRGRAARRKPKAPSELDLDKVW